MLKPSGRFHSLVVPLFTWLVLLIPFLIYQRYYVSSQQAYLTEHGFRLLSAVGRQLDSYVDSISKTVESAPSDQAPSEDDRRQAYLGYLRTFHPELPRDALNVAEVPTKTCPAPTIFSVEFGPRPQVFERCFKAPIRGRLSLDTAIRERLRGIGEDYFDDVLIANSKGEVLFQRATDTRVTKLDHLVLAAEDKSTRPPAPAPQPQAEGNPNPQPPPEAPSFAALSESSTVRDVKLAGDDYKLFLQPLRLSSAGRGAEDNDKLVLCGLWRTERLNSESLALPYSSVIWFALFCVAASSFAWPFLKINYMSYTERLRRSQGWLLMLSMFLGAASATLMVLNASYSSHVRESVQEDLHTLAGQIKLNVRAELRLALDQLADLSKDPQVRALAATKKWNPRPKFLESKSDLTYPYFDMAFWADTEGQQRVKFTVDSRPTPQTPVKDYAFFRDVMSQPKSGPIVPLLATIGGRLQYSLQPLISPNTGLFQAVIAASFPKGSDSETIKVQALVIRPLSLVDPVLPPDFGFAVLDRDGKVLFHSNPLRNLSENFIQECKDQPALRAALFSDAEQNLDIVYSGKDRQALVTKVAYLGPEPATLIVFHNTEINLTVNMAIVLIGSVLMTFYTIAILVVAAIDLLRGAKYPPELSWPRRDCSLRYALVFAGNGVLILFFLLLYSHLGELGLLALTAGILLLALFSTAVLMMKKQLPIALARWDRTLQPHFKVAYVAAAVSLLIAVTMVPCFGFFKFSHDAASELAAKHGQLRVLKNLLERRNRISGFYQDLQAPTKYAEDRINQDLDRYDTVPLKFLSYGSPAGEVPPEKEGKPTPEGLYQHYKAIAAATQDEFDHLLAGAARWFPSNELGGQMRMLHFDPDDDEGERVKWSDRQDPADSQREIFRLARLVGGVPDPDLTVDSQFAKWPGVSLGGWLWLGLLWFLVGRWVFLLMKNIFLPDSQSLPPLERVNWQSCGDVTANSLVLGDPRSGKSSRLTRLPGIEYVDLRVELDRPYRKTFAPDAVVALDHFEFNMDNQPYNQARLQLLERLLYKDRCRVVLVSSIDPAYYLCEGDPGILADNPPAASELLERWARVMSAFQKVEFEDPGKSAFDEQLNQHRHDPQEKRLVQWIEEECSPTAYLRGLGLVLFQRHRREERFDPPTLLNELADRSDSYYSLLWSMLTARERLALYQLAKDGWANTKNDRAIRQLQRQGFIRCEPMVRVMNESFRLFILRAQDQGEIAEWEREGEQSSWRSLKIGFIATAVGLTAWLFYAQKDLFQVSIGYIVTLGGAIAAITNIVGNIRGRAPSVAKASETGPSA